MIYSKISATGSYLPDKILNNKELETMVDTSDEWIVSRSGIEERRISATNEKTSDLAINAALDAIYSSGFDKDKIDLIIVATSTAEMIFPSTACLVQRALKLNNTPAFDVQAACAGFMYALTTADCYIKSGMATNVLVIGMDAISRILDYTDRTTCVLFGDGAGAVILSKSDETGIIGSELHADGCGVNSLSATGHIDHGRVVGNPYVSMDGPAVYKMAVKNLASVASSLLAKTGYKTDQIDWLIPHQANIRIIESTARHLGLSMDKVIVTVSKHGNTSAASVPLALNEAIKNGKVQRGELLLLEGVGAGFTWGASLIRY